MWISLHRMPDPQAETIFQRIMPQVIWGKNLLEPTF
jgi:hypothetical protein